MLPFPEKISERKQEVVANPVVFSTESQQHESIQNMCQGTRWQRIHTLLIFCDTGKFVCLSSAFLREFMLTLFPTATFRQC